MATKIIWLQDIGEKPANKEQEVLIDMSDFYSDDYSEIVKYHKPLTINGVDVTVMDLFNLPLYTDDFSTDADFSPHSPLNRWPVLPCSHHTYKHR